jgi:hypothetical protein
MRNMSVCPPCIWLKSIDQPQVLSIVDKHNWNRVFGYNSRQLTWAHPGNLETHPRHKMLAKTLAAVGRGRCRGS